jgi:hypothetical protein
MNDFWKNVNASRNYNPASNTYDYIHGAYDTGDYLTAKITEALGHSPVVGQDGILAMMDVTTCNGGPGVALVVSFEGYMNITNVPVCDIGP